VVNGIACYLQFKRLGFARECSNRSGDDFFIPFPVSRARIQWPTLFGSRIIQYLYLFNPDHQ